MKNKAHNADRIAPVIKPLEHKPYPLNPAESPLPRYGVYKISFPNGDCVVYGSWQYKRDIERHLEKGDQQSFKNAWFRKAYQHFGRAKAELLCQPLHFDYLHDLETLLAAEHNATLNFRPHTFKIKLWLFCRRMAQEGVRYEGFVGSEVQAVEAF
ncbi:hypothetical protein AWB78_05325 [Caballeronia calidae]|uniref:Uncharacterized protein n=1 Tax=Caballeronia calidae TaxID=1777139 RepID=A0A158DM77_9BURK|nr:hypothetical protein [Caballeronia calidae]SAK95296.1 hypothetical protein AWB78_05325 [Caballeronia calidae]